MQRKLLFLFLFILSTRLFADNDLSKAEVVITSESSPSSMVNGTVNTIEGSFYFSSPVLHVPGCEPMHVVHHYNSKNRYAAWAGSGMSLNYSFWITGKSFPGQDKEKHGKHCYINAESPGGSIISCLAKDRIGSNTFYLDPAIVYIGTTRNPSSQQRD